MSKNEDSFPEIVTYILATVGGIALVLLAVSAVFYAVTGLFFSYELYEVEAEIRRLNREIEALKGE